MLNGYDEYECDYCGQQFSTCEMVLGVQDLCDQCHEDKQDEETAS